MMLFLLRCVLWLSFVYAAILLPRESQTFRSDVAAASHAITSVSVAPVVAAAARLCASTPAGCVDDAARLTSMIAAAQSAPKTVAKSTPATPRPLARTPHPGRDPIASLLADRT